MLSPCRIVGLWALTVVLTGGLAAAMLGCRSREEPAAAVLERLRVPCEQRLAQIEAIRDGLASIQAPPEALTPPAASIDLQMREGVLDPLRPTWNTVTVHDEHLQELDRYTDHVPLALVSNYNVVTQAAGIVRRGVHPGPPRYEAPIESGPRVRKVLEALLQVRYVLVIQTERFVEPRLERTAAETTYEPGAFAGLAILFEVESGDCLGGFAFEAASSERIEVTAAGPEHYEGILQADLAENARHALATALRERLPEAHATADGWD